MSISDRVFNSFSVLEYKAVSAVSEMKRKWTKGISRIEKVILKNCLYAQKSKTVSGKHRP